MQLTPHISFEEFTNSVSHPDLVAKNRVDALAHMDDIRVSADNAEKIRALPTFGGAAMYIHSGFRNKELNSAVGGSPTSQHCVGQAFDFNIDGWTSPEQLLATLKVIETSGIPYHQLLIENGCIHFGCYQEGASYNGQEAFWSKGVKSAVPGESPRGD